MSINKKIVIVYNGKKTTLVVRDKIDTECSNNKLSLIGVTLDFLGLEEVPIKEILPNYQKIKHSDELVKNKCCCDICYQDYSVGEYKRKLNCVHLFHKKCIDKWLKIDFSCPICRHGII